jgi:predicted  nucleic acid-binding Zn-ribbon protein
VNEQLRLLIELQKLDSVILSNRLKIDAIPATIASHEGPLNNAVSAYENAKQHHASLEKKKKDKEGEIADINEKIKKLEQRTSEIKNNKEYQSHLKEIEKVKKDLKSLEDGLLAVIDEIEGTSQVTAIEKTRIDEEKAKIEAIKKELEKEALKLEEESKRLKNDRKTLTDKIESDIYALYTTIMKATRGTAVVEAKDEACHGCNIHIPPQLFVEIKNNDDIINCPQCRRILYYKKPE